MSAIDNDECLDAIYGDAIKVDGDAITYTNNPLKDKKQGSAHHENNVDEMLVQTMFKMVEDVTVSFEGRDIMKRCLYLTNKQAALIDEQAMVRCLSEMELTDAKLLIELRPCMGGKTAMIFGRFDGKHRVSPPGQYSYDNIWECQLSSELNLPDENLSETQVIEFLKKCVVPIAMQTKAIILIRGCNDCIFAEALAKVVIPIQVRLGKDCPFKVVATVHQLDIVNKAYSAVDETPAYAKSLAHQVSKECQRWSKRIDFLKPAFASLNVNCYCDLPSAASHLIVIENLDNPAGEAIFNVAPKVSFDKLFLKSISQNIPSISIQSFRYTGPQFLADRLNLQIPILLMDSRERTISLRRDLLDVEPSTSIAKLSNQFPKLCKSDVLRMKVVNGALTMEGRIYLLTIAEKMVEDLWSTFTDHAVVNAYDSSTLAFFHAALRLGSSPLQNKFATGVAYRQIPLYQEIADFEQLIRENKSTTASCAIPQELLSRVIDFLATRDKARQIIASKAVVEAWLQKKHSEDIERLRQGATEYRDKLDEMCSQIESDGGYFFEPYNQSDRLAIEDVLSHPNSFSGSLFDLEEASRIIGRIGRIHRLPESNSLEGLKLLRTAWDKVEIYHYTASTYKFLAKSSYFLLLILGIFVTTTNIQDDDIRSVVDPRVSTLIASIISSLIVGFVHFTNPIMRWQSLRAAALQIESHIFRFRTRTEEYASNSEDFDESAVLAFKHFLSYINELVLNGADLKSTAFYSIQISPNKHLQHDPVKIATKTWTGIFESTSTKSPSPSPSPSRPAKVEGDDNKPPSTEESLLDYFPDLFKEGTDTISAHDLFKLMQQKNLDRGDADIMDNHYHPVLPDEYIVYRVDSCILFYKGRLPHYSRIKKGAQLFIALGSISSILLAFFNISYWAILSTIITSSVTALIEFNGTNSKLQRYSSTINALEEMKVWWDTLPQIDRSMVSNIILLVKSTEEILAKEQSSWRSTAQEKIKAFNQVSTQEKESSS